MLKNRLLKWIMIFLKDPNDAKAFRLKLLKAFYFKLLRALPLY